MTAKEDYKAYIRTREYKRLPFKAKLRIGWEEDKRRWREGNLLSKIVFPFSFILGWLVALCILLITLAIVGVMLIAYGVFFLLKQWQTYAIILVVGMVLILVHLGII